MSSTSSFSPTVAMLHVAIGGAVGAVGISGDSSDKDEYCAIAGVKAAGYTPAPEAPVSDWNAAGL